MPSGKLPDYGKLFHMLPHEKIQEIVTNETFEKLHKTEKLGLRNDLKRNPQLLQSVISQKISTDSLLRMTSSERATEEVRIRRAYSRKRCIDESTVEVLRYSPEQLFQILNTVEDP